jgi:hypothetical protein
MVDLVALWLPILLSAVFVFLVSSLIHMALPIHKRDYVQLPQEDRLLDAMRGVVPPGQYRFPWCGSMQEFGTPAMQEKMRRGPMGTLIVLGGMNMGRSLGQWFVLSIVVGVFVAYQASLTLPVGSDGMRVFRFASAGAMLGYAFASVDDSIWKGVKWSTTWKFVLDGVAYGLVTGATFAWLWPAA